MNYLEAEPEYHNRFSEWAVVWMIWISIPGRGKRVFSSPKHPYMLWDPPILPFSGIEGRNVV
jgi:hypothetical protein